MGVPRTPRGVALSKRRYRIAIIGGGPAGSACALALLQKGMRDILIIESSAYDQFRIGESIPPESRRLFRSLGIYESFVAEAHEPCYGSCSYWGGDKRGYNDSLLNLHGHGWHLDRRRFNQFLARQAQAAGAELAPGTTLLDSESHQAGFRLHLENSGSQSSVDADFVIDASGIRGLFARQRGSKKIHGDPLVCLAARFAIDDQTRTVSKTTHLEAVEHGWWYAARLPDDTLLVTFYTDAETLKARGLQKPESWHAQLRQAVNTVRLTQGAQCMDDAIRSFPAPSYRLDQVCGKNWLAVGDAASAYDPITSQGIMKSLAHGRLAADAIQRRELGDQLSLDRFAGIVMAEYRHYLGVRRHFYGIEQRWPTSAFWRNRHAQEEIN
jgi:flavin-dependent dehydrogenase